MANASILAKNTNGFDSSSSNPSSSSFKDCFEQFALDLGRTDYPAKWYPALRIGIRCFFSIVACSGILMLNIDNWDSPSAFIINILEFVSLFYVNKSNIYVTLAICCGIFIVFFVFIFYYIYIFRLYMNDKCPSTFQLHLWLFLYRVILPIFSLFCPSAFFNGLFSFFKEVEDRTPYFMQLGFGAVFLILDLILEISSSVAFNSTPIIRLIDNTQFWFAYSSLDWYQHFIFMLCALLSLFFQLFDLKFAGFCYFGLMAVFSVFVVYFITSNIPYIRIKLNILYFALFISTIFAASLPLFYYFAPKFAGFVVFICIAVFIGAYFFGQNALLAKCRKIVQRFSELGEQPNETEEEEGNEYKMLHLGLLDDANRNVDYDKLELKTVQEFSAYVVIGFLFKMPDIESHKFLQYAAENCQKGQILYSCCQITLALKSDMRLLKEFHTQAELCAGQVSGSKCFFRLLNELRQEQLSQLNTPLLDAINKAKKASHRLAIRISDFWGAVLKQKLPIMISLLPEISDELEETKYKFERLIRNYPQAPVVIRESINFYHKTAGDHRKTLEIQAKFNKGNKQHQPGDSASHSESNTTDYANNENIDENFLKQMEPYYTAQDTVMGIKSTPITCFTVILVVLGFLVITLPTILLTLSIYFVTDFQLSFTDVKIFGDATYSISRIPQLVRRKNLFRKGIVHEHFPETGAPLGTLLEFITEDAIMPAIQKYIDQIDSITEQYLDKCKKDSFVKDLCESKIYTKKVGLSVSNQTGFDLLYSFKTTSETILAKPSEAWNNMDTDDDLIFLYENIDQVYRALKDIMNKLRDEVMKTYFDYSNVSTILYCIVWLVSGLTMIPLLAYSIFGLRYELVHMMKLLFAIPKSDISALRWVTKTKTINPAAGAGGHGLKKNTMNTSSESSISGSQLSENKQASIDQFTTSLSTNEKHLGGLFNDYLIKSIIFILIYCLLSTVGVLVYQTSMNNILSGAANYIEAIVIAASGIASYVWAQELFVVEENQMQSLMTNQNLEWDFEKWRTMLKRKSYDYHESLLSSFDQLLYGKNLELIENQGEYETATKPALFISENMVTAYIRSKPANSVRTDYTVVNGLLHDVYYSMSCESQMRLLDSIARYFMDPDVIFPATDDVRYFLNVERTTIEKSRTFVYHFEHLLFAHLDLFFTEGRDLLYSETDRIASSNKNLIIFLFTMIYLIDIFMFVGVLVPSVLRVRRHHVALRSLMLLNEPETLLKVPEITKWLGGNRKLKKGEKAVTSTAYDEDFIVNASKCGLLLGDIDLKILDTNSTVTTYFKGVTEFVGKNIRDLFINAVVDKDKALFFKAFDKEMSLLKRNIPTKGKNSLNTSILASNGQVMYVAVKIMGHPADEDDITSPIATISVSINDRTTEYFQEALVESEKRKSEKLVTSLLPPAIVKRMNEGETDISFEVQTATVLFSKVVAWETLMLQMDAKQVVAFLNTLFSGFDEELAKNPVITKLKTIGHIYMIAGGLFSDSSVNHAQIMVNYALNMLKIVENINATGEFQFKVTIGINTGGPINCGILGVTRPVFDILGDVVNVSSRMNSSSIPGYIQISPGTYEAIKFLGFYIRERGEIQVKGKGLMKTYIVQAKKDDPELNLALKAGITH